MEPETTRVLIQGFGNVGSNAAKLMSESGYKVIGIGEYDGGLYNKNGIDIDARLVHRQRNGTITGFKGAEAANASCRLATACDIHTHAATENVITSRNADQIKAR